MRAAFFWAGRSAYPIEGVTGNTFTPSSTSFFDGSTEYYARVDYLKKMFDYSLLYYRETEMGTAYIR